MALSGKILASQLQKLLPRGAAWPRGLNSTLYRLLRALADELERLSRRVDDLIDEADPRTALELLPEWETELELPGPCMVGLEQTIAERRGAAHSKHVRLGGQSIQYFIDLAAALGYTVTITEFRPFEVDASAVGDALHGDDWLFVWQVNAPEETIREFNVGDSVVGEPLRNWGNTLLECTLSEVAPAHHTVLFAYGSQ